MKISWFILYKKLRTEMFNSGQFSEKWFGGLKLRSYFYLGTIKLLLAWLQTKFFSILTGTWKVYVPASQNFSSFFPILNHQEFLTEFGKRQKLSIFQSKYRINSNWIWKILKFLILYGLTDGNMIKILKHFLKRWNLSIRTSDYQFSEKRTQVLFI